jgi:hypothetical protein
VACASFDLIWVNDNRHSVSKADIAIAKVVAKLQQERSSISKYDTHSVAFAETA